MLNLTPAEIGNITRIEYQGQLVITTAQLAEFYECTVENIRDNFRNNRDRFVETKHMFVLRGLELKNFKRELAKNYPLGGLAESLRFAPTLYLWTKRGAARHAKMLNTDRAWEVFELLEDNYFEPTVDYYDTTPGADFWWEHEKKSRQKKDPNSNKTLALNLRRVGELRRLADRIDNAELRGKLLAEAAKILVIQ